MTRDTRAQAFTLEGVAAAVLLLASLVFALQVAAVTPNSGSTANPNVGTQQAWVASGLLAEAAAGEGLRETVLYWNENTESFQGVEEGYDYHVDGRDMGTELTLNLENSIYDRRFAYNLEVSYLTKDGKQIERTPIVYRGTPSDDAVRVVEYVTLYDDDTLPSGSTLLEEEQNFYAPKVELDTCDDSATTELVESCKVYNVLRVEVTVWRV